MSFPEDLQSITDAEEKYWRGLERERIIELLLNENQCPENDCNEVQCLLTRLLISLIKQKNVIELIKGEK